ncbi:MAG: hypothetical protein ACK4N5_02280, partial [Myxococcales bacterium]
MGRGALEVSRMALLALALLASLAPGVARADAAGGAALGLPLVPLEKGWARYVSRSAEGVAHVVIRVGAAQKDPREKLRWITLELGTPSEGVVTLDFLVAGADFTPDAVRRMRVTVPGQPPQDSAPELEGDLTASRPTRRKVGTRRMSVGGQALQVTEYVIESLHGALRVGWSPQVPGLGL